MGFRHYGGRVAVLLTILNMCYSVQVDTDTVVTNNGPIEGIRKLYETNRTVYQFRRIPFAMPPLGDLRFSRPVPRDNWNGTLDATEFGPSCTQYLFENDKRLLPNTNISEDCLFLNIYVPNNLRSTGSDDKSVMVWIHGGGFTAGQGTLFDGSYLALQGDVIIVTINYRLGFLGFLSTEDENAAGNYGLMDQRLAIQWVKDNINHFGGKPSNICIFGESAGGHSVGLQSIIPANNGLFQKVISHSGAIYSPFMAIAPRQAAEKLGSLLKCNVSDTKQLVSCLKNVSAANILSKQGPATSQEPGYLTFTSPISPVVDGYLIPDDPIKLLANKSTEAYKMFVSLDVMAGINSAEGGLAYFHLRGFQEKWHFDINKGIPKKVLCDLVAPTVARDYYHGDTNVSSAVCAMYTREGSDIQEQARSTVNVYADTQFVVPTVDTLVTHAGAVDGGSSYQYLFSHQPAYPWIDERPAWLIGANHAGELPFVFGLDAMYPKTANKSADELNLSRRMMQYWTNFAKTSNPNGEGLPEWPTYDDTRRRFMNLTIDLAAGSDVYRDRVHFWRAIPGKEHPWNSATALFVNNIVFLGVICLLLETW